MSVVLVTGGAGYVGSHACKALAEAGFQPVTYDSLVRGHRQAVQWGPLEVGDVCDRTRLARVIDQWRPTAVMHFAAFAYVGESVADPAMYYANNAAGTLALLEVMREARMQRIVFSSTCATYGLPRQLPIAEDHPQCPVNPYGRSKLMVEQMLQDFDAAYGMRSISLRYFNAAGADPEGRLGELHEPETHLIPLALDVAAGRRPHLEILGTDYDTPDGTCIRDYVHVADLARAHVLSLQALEAGSDSRVYNLGNGRGHSVRDVVDCVARVTGRPVPSVERPRRAGDPGVLVADATRIRRELGWVPQFGEIQRIVQTAWHWHQNPFTDEPTRSSR